MDYNNGRKEEVNILQIHTIKNAIFKSTLIFIVLPCILITLKFLSPTNAPLYYTYKMLKCTVKISHDWSYMFRSTWTIIRELCRTLLKLQFCGDSKNTSLYVQQCCGKKCFRLWCVLCAYNTHHTPQLETRFTNTAEHLTTYFYWLSPQNCNFSKVRHSSLMMVQVDRNM